tara:strand:- start:5092 stop:5832 length:741 start_codon:yes stop_codon:yes gene_type:complete
MAIIPNGQQFHTVNSTVDTENKGSASTNANRASFSMTDITATVINSGGGGGLAGSGTAFTIPIWSSASSLGDSNIKRTLVYSAGNGGQYELNGNLKIFGESSGSGVAALFVEDSLGAKVQVRDVNNATSAINSELEIKAFDNFVSFGTSGQSPIDTILINAKGNTKMRFDTQNINGTDYFCFRDSGQGAIGGPGVSGGWEKVFFNLDSYADNSGATAAGLTQNQLYQTDGTGSAPLNVAGIVMCVQ